MQYFTVEEAANVTRMSESWWRQKISKQEIGHTRIGGRVFIPETVIDKLFEKGYFEPRIENDRPD